ncbi:hypothetical protein C8R46DRAFT_1219289 [Mycena filopes]|nr:hypothetical protein C8R46DRAFT_1219289 [Mycena filopes]
MSSVHPAKLRAALRPSFDSVNLEARKRRQAELEEFVRKKRQRGNAQQPEDRVAKMSIQPKMQARWAAASESESEPDEETRQLDESIRKDHLAASEATRDIVRSLDKNMIDTLLRNLHANNFGWGIHPNLLLVLCPCGICTNYLTHLKGRASEWDYAPEGMEEEWAGQYDDFNSVHMQKLFLVRDLMARAAAFEYSYEDPRGAGELQGSLVTAHAELLKLRAERDAALSTQAAWQQEMEALQTAKQELTVRCEELSAQLQASTVAALSAQATRQQEMEALQTAKQELTVRCEELSAQLQASMVAALSAQATRQQEIEALQTATRELKAACDERSAQLQTTMVAVGAAQSEIAALRSANARLSKERDEALLERVHTAGVAQNKIEIHKTSLDSALHEIDALKAERDKPTAPTSAGDWLTMKAPSSSASIETLARWVQFHEIPIQGIVFHDPDFTLDKRDLRGYREVQFRLIAKNTIARQADRKNRRQTELEMVGLLAAPGEYGSVLRRTGTLISAIVRYEPFSLSSSGDNQEVAQVLAGQGMTLAMADDAWQYVYQFLETAAKSNAVGAAERLVFINTGHLIAPPGLNPVEDKFARPPDLPRKRSTRK